VNESEKQGQDAANMHDEDAAQTVPKTSQGHGRGLDPDKTTGQERAAEVRQNPEDDPTAVEPEPEAEQLPAKPDIEMPDNDEGDDPPTDEEEAEDEEDIEFLEEGEADEDDTVDNTEEPEEPNVFEPSEDDYEEVPED